MGLNAVGSLQREQDRQLRRARDARAAGFGGTAEKALERADEIGRQVDAAQEAAGAGAWCNQAHPLGPQGARLLPSPREREVNRWMAKLSDAEKLTAEWVAKQVRAYGPLTREHAAHVADRAATSKRTADRMLAHGLSQVVSEMEPGEVISRSVPWWKRL